METDPIRHGSDPTYCLYFEFTVSQVRKAEEKEKRDKEAEEARLKRAEDAKKVIIKADPSLPAPTRSVPCKTIASSHGLCAKDAKKVIIKADPSLPAPTRSVPCKITASSHVFCSKVRTLLWIRIGH